MILDFDYQMKFSYSQPVSLCYFTIKCIPMNTCRQSLLHYQIQMNPNISYSCGEDSFKNKKIYGSIHQEHHIFEFKIQGQIQIDDIEYEEMADLNQIGMYRYPRGLCVPDDELIRYYESLRLDEEIDPYLKCIRLMSQLHTDFLYVPKQTDVNTSASAAWKLKKGVCQDYAHIYIVLARLANIPCRYVCGLMVGEGKSHAWVEVLCDGKWIGLDPTNNCKVNSNYIKLGHGFDASSCSINRGIMYGGGQQIQEIRSIVGQQ